MRVRPGAEFLLGGLAGVVLISLLTLLVWHFRPAETPAEQLARKASRVDLVSRMQVALASSSEAERSAVLATTDEDSRAFADQARAAIGQVEAARAELAPLLAPAGLERERALLEAFSGDFARLRKVDEEILVLAVKNTNVKAYALAYGPAAQALGELDAALARLAERRAGSAEGRPVLTLASRARIALLRLQVLLPPHIAEESNEKMDRIEASMAAEEREASQGLTRLARIPALAGDPDLALAQARLAAFLELKSRILALSRENTNVASLALSLDQQRKAMAVCAEALGALQQAVLEEPISGVTYGRQPVPTR
jgi:hypothetical protein